MTLLVIGDSQVKYVVLGAEGTCLAFPGRRVQDMFPPARDAIAHASVVVFHVGTNNIGGDEDAEQVLLHYRALVTSTRRVNPLIRVVMTAILPRHPNKFVSSAQQDYMRRNRVAKEVNWMLSSLCSELHLSICSFWNTFLNRDFISRDGLHLSPSGVAFLRRAYLSHSCPPTIFSKPPVTLSSINFPLLPKSVQPTSCNPPKWPRISTPSPLHSLSTRPAKKELAPALRTRDGRDVTRPGQTLPAR